MLQIHINYYWSTKNKIEKSYILPNINIYKELSELGTWDFNLTIVPRSIVSVETRLRNGILCLVNTFSGSTMLLPKRKAFKKGNIGNVLDYVIMIEMLIHY